MYNSPFLDEYSSGLLVVFANDYPVLLRDR